MLTLTKVQQQVDLQETGAVLRVPKVDVTTMTLAAMEILIQD